MKSRPLDIGNHNKSKLIRSGRIISNLASPPMVSAILGYIAAFISLPFWEGLLWGTIFGVLVSLFPLLTVVYLLKSGRVNDLHLETAKDRRIPYVVGILGSLLALVVVEIFAGPDLLGFLALANLIGLILLGIINNFWLISSHMAAVTLAAIYLVYIFGAIALIIMLPLMALVFVVRLSLQRHTVMQLIAGIGVGIFSVWFAGILVSVSI